MYLKSIELIGFKSFVRPTRLEFEPGVIAIVGPNGCGKSNVVDAIRWVLGEQSAKILRGSRMEDFIFNGTDNLKPLGMAEASITCADCENVLGTEYNEVTITRRVFRSGEGEYLINKTPVRLKDVQRLFMNTGIGTTSYSVMEQGRIDQILSSHPEDRRDVFEEASGITKFKADRKEADRKLEQTEANLLRLSDVIREVKRQIGSLQRQAGKARRYKALRDELRKLDICSTKDRVSAAEKDIKKLESQLTSVSDQLEAARNDISEIEEKNSNLRKLLGHTEHEIDAMMDARAQAAAKLARVKDSIQINNERIHDTQHMSEQDTKEIDRAAAQIESRQQSLDQLTADLEIARKEKQAAEIDHRDKTETLTQHEDAVDKLEKLLEALQSEYVELESACSGLQNELIRMDTGKKGDVIRRERLAAERIQLEKENKDFEECRSDMEKVLHGLQAEVSQRAKLTDELATHCSQKQEEIAQIESACAGLRSQIAVEKAQADLLGRSDSQPAGARLVLDGSNPLNIDTKTILGPITDCVDAEPEFRIALEAALRAWLDAVVVADTASAVRILAELQKSRQGSSRLLVANTGAPPASAQPPAGPGTRLTDHVKCAKQVRPMIERLIGNVSVIESLDVVPMPVPSHAVYVTRDGAFVSGNGVLEFWMQDREQTDPVSRKRLLSKLREDATNLENRLEQERKRQSALQEEAASAATALEKARVELEKQRHDHAVKEGELQVISREAAHTRDRLETVTWEIAKFDKDGDSGQDRKLEISRQMDELTDRKARVKADIETRTMERRALERQRPGLSSKALESKLRHAEAGQKAEFLEKQIAPAQAHLAELQEMVAARSQGLTSRKENIDRLKQTIETAQCQIASLEEDVGNATARLETVHQDRQKREKELEISDAELAERRSLSDELRNRKSELDVKYAEARMRSRNMIDRIASEYGLTPEAFFKEPEPEWEGGKPDIESLDTRIAELRAKLEAMGPVNLVAIDEYEELEERHAFLCRQQEDLINARQKLLRMIAQINRTTSEMFLKTFEEANRNFDSVFKKLFNGGSARLVLADDEDVLECGIEIIARPPGKRLQNVSLLSGGERTLTAVSLLFAIYMIKPSPFCVLDELDAPLDDSNIGRFIEILQGFLDQSQFLIITHNQRTISAAGVIYGVTMEEKGVSKIVSMKFVEPRSKEEAAEPALTS